MLKPEVTVSAREPQVWHLEFKHCVPGNVGQWCAIPSKPQIRQWGKQSMPIRYWYDPDTISILIPEGGLVSAHHWHTHKHYEWRCGSRGSCVCVCVMRSGTWQCFEFIPRSRQLFYPMVLLSLPYALHHPTGTRCSSYPTHHQCTWAGATAPPLLFLLLLLLILTQNKTPCSVNWMYPVSFLNKMFGL